MSPEAICATCFEVSLCTPTDGVLRCPACECTLRRAEANAARENRRAAAERRWRTDGMTASEWAMRESQPDDAPSRFRRAKARLRERARLRTLSTPELRRLRDSLYSDEVTT